MLPLDLPGILVTKTEPDDRLFAIHAGCEGRPAACVTCGSLNFIGQVLLGACFSQWLGQKAVALQDITSDHLTRYLRYRARRLRPRCGDHAALMHLLDFLRHKGVVPEENGGDGGEKPSAELAFDLVESQGTIDLVRGIGVQTSVGRSVRGQGIDVVADGTATF